MKGKIVMLNDFGFLSIRAYTADGALPVMGATVRIQGAEEENRFISRSLVTDEDGMTETVRLPAPSTGFSMKPSPAEAPYALYDIEITADGYYTKKIYGLSVFAGTTSIQLVNMIPESDDALGNSPSGSIDATIPENENL